MVVPRGVGAANYVIPVFGGGICGSIRVAQVAGVSSLYLAQVLPHGWKRKHSLWKLLYQGLMTCDTGSKKVLTLIDTASVTREYSMSCPHF